MKKKKILEKRNKQFTRLNVTQVYEVSTMTGGRRIGDSRKPTAFRNTRAHTNILC